MVFRDSPWVPDTRTSPWIADVRTWVPAPEPADTVDGSAEISMEALATDAPLSAAAPRVRMTDPA